VECGIYGINRSIENKVDNGLITILESRESQRCVLPYYIKSVVFTVIHVEYKIHGVYHLFTEYGICRVIREYDINMVITLLENMEFILLPLY
jgi:hypothetical protein